MYFNCNQHDVTPEKLSNNSVKRSHTNVLVDIPNPPNDHDGLCNSKIIATSRESNSTGVHRQNPKRSPRTGLLLSAVTQPRKRLPVLPTTDPPIYIPPRSPHRTVGITSIPNHRQRMSECGHIRFLSIIKTYNEFAVQA